MGNFKEHGLMLFLGPPAYLGFIKFQADNKQGRSFAGQRIFNEVLYRLGYLSEVDYEVLKKRYSKSLTNENQKPTLQQVKEKEEVTNLTKTFSDVIEQWNIHPQKEWRAKWFKQAKKWEDKIPNAKLIIDLINGEDSNDGNSNIN